MLKIDIWDEVRQELLNIEQGGAYYAGATLFVPFGPRCEGSAPSRSEIGLNLNGTAFLLGGHSPRTPEEKPEQPRDITRLVRIIYIIYKVPKL